MKCESAIRRLLEADPAELRGRGDGPLATHLAECDRCARLAATLTAELGELDQALAAYGAGGDPDSAADQALASIRSTSWRRASMRPSSWPRSVWLPLAAAAALVGVLLVGPDGGPAGDTKGGDPRGGEPSVGTPPISTPGPAPLPAPPGNPGRVAVTPPTSRGVAVLETANPKITIIWLYEREES